MDREARRKLYKELFDEGKKIEKIGKVETDNLAEMMDSFLVLKIKINEIIEIINNL